LYFCDPTFPPIKRVACPHATLHEFSLGFWHLSCGFT
jgi:hypothetical protein